MKWSNEQLEAIRVNEGNVLINAGAGSGKTAVLTEHVFHLLKNGAKLDRLLVLTFTNLASAEMKSRIRKKIADPESGITELVDKIDASHIETFDAFALYIVKKYHYVLNLPKNIGILDGTIETIKKRKILDEIFDRHYEEKEPVFVEMISQFADKDDKNIKDFILDIYRSVNLEIDQKSYIEKLKTNYCTDSFIEKVIEDLLTYYREQIYEIIALTQNENPSEEDSELIIEAMNEILTHDNYDDFISYLESKKFPTKRRHIEKNFGRDEAKDIYTKLKKKIYGNSEEIRAFIISKQDFSVLFVSLYEELQERFNEFKSESNLYSFADIQMMALSLIQNPAISEEIKNSFDYIMVDEYQDTSDIQERVIQRLANDNVFMVGDVKQSIYAFRNANCTIFQKKYELYKNKQGGKKIDMNDNFRSRKEFIDDLNKIFSVLMYPDVNIIDYKSDHIVKSGNKKYLTQVAPNQHYGIEQIIYDVNEKDNNDRYEVEARIIAQDIIKKVNSGYLIADKGQDGEMILRPCSFKDFTIIMDRGNYFQEYSQIFTEYNIPLLVYQDENVTMSKVLLTMRNVLKLINLCSTSKHNTSPEFIHSFISVARSFLFECDDKTIYDYVKNQDYYSSPIIKQIQNFADEHANNSLEELVIAAIDEFSFYESIFKIGDYVSNASKIELVIRLAASFDEIGMNLDDFVTYFNDISTYEVEIKLESAINGDDAVKIMNIHKSKGLEFPVCYYPGLYKEFYYAYQKKSFLVSDSYGIISINKEEKENNFLKFLEGLKLKQSIFEEKLRLLYVSLTRTKENAILVSGQKDKRKNLSRIQSCVSLGEFLESIKYKSDHRVLSEVEAEKPKLVREEKQSRFDTEVLKIDEITMSSETIAKKRASMSVSDDSQIGAMAFGSKIHYLLEIVDYETKDTSFIDDPAMRQNVENVLKNELFRDVKNDQLRHEFEFYDEKNEVHGIIDCLIVKETGIDIVDFKLKNISKEQYVTQMSVYRSYIAQITDKPIRTYLLATMTGESEEVYEN